MPRQSHNPDNLFNSLQYGFSQITVSEGSRIVTISGQVGWDADEQIVGDDLRSQTMRAFANLKNALATVDASLDDVLSLRIYIVADVMDDLSPVSEALKHYFPENPPTSNWLGVVRLADKAFLIEVEALAVMS